MLIGGQQVGNNWDSIKKQLMGLLPGNHQMEVEYQETISESDFDSLDDKAAEKAKKVWEQQKDKNSLKDALSARMLAADKSGSQEEPTLKRAEHLQQYGDTWMSAGIVQSESSMLEETEPTYQKVISALTEASAVYKRYGRFDRQAVALGALYGATIMAIKASEPNSQDAERLRHTLESIRKEALEAYVRKNHNDEINPDAYWVTQGQAGFSDEEPIGTANIHNCVCLVIRAENGKVALAHLDEFTDIASLQEIFDRMPSNNLKGTVVGARIETDEILRKTINFLRDRNVDIDIESGMVLNPTQSTSLVVTPETENQKFAITYNEAPWKDFHQAAIEDGARVLADYGQPVHIAFDLTVSTRRAPTFLDSGTVSFLHTFPKDEVEMRDWCEAEMESRGIETVIQVEAALALGESHREAVEYIKTHLFETIEEFKKRDPTIQFKDAPIKAAVEAIAKCQIHIGEGANEANQPLVDYITKTPSKLITIDRSSKPPVANFNSDGLKKDVKFPKQPLDAIAPDTNQPTQSGKRPSNAGIDSGARDDSSKRRKRN